MNTSLPEYLLHGCPTCMWTAMRSLRVRSKEYTSARPPTPMRKVAGSVAVVTEELRWAPRQTQSGKQIAVGKHRQGSVNH